MRLILALFFASLAFGQSLPAANTPIPLLAEDAAPPTVEQLQAQLTAKDQQIAQLQRQITEGQRDVFLYRQSFNACLDQAQRPALNPAQQRMIEHGSKLGDKK